MSTKQPAPNPPPVQEPPARTAPPQPASIPAGIPIRRLNLVRSMQAPGHPATDCIEARELANRDRWEIEFIPQVRAFRITYFPGQQAKPVATEYLVERHVRTWIPAPPPEPPAK